MALWYAVHAVWRVWLYVVYGVVALVVYQFVFSLDAPYAGYAALGIAVLAVLKDVFDHFTEASVVTSFSFKFVDHNPFNIVLLWGLATGVFVIADQTMFYLVAGLAAFDLVLDGYVDFKKEPSPYIVLALVMVVAAAVTGIHQTIGFSALYTSVIDLLQHVPFGDTDLGTRINETVQ